MRKTVSILLVAILLTTTVGVAIKKHFCGGHLVDIAVFSNASCNCDDKDMKEDCCSDEKATYRLSVEQTIPSIVRIPSAILFNLLTFANSIQNDKIECNSDIVIEDYNLPPPRLLAIYLINCSLTFYG